MRARSTALWVCALGVAQGTSCGGRTPLGISTTGDPDGGSGTDSAAGSANGGGGDSGKRSSREASVEAGGVDAGGGAGAQGTGGSAFECESSYGCRLSGSDAAGAFLSCDPGTGQCVTPCMG